MGQDDRDKKFEQALTRRLRGRDAAQPAEVAGVAGQGSACPDAEMLAAFHERMLTDEEMNATKEHVAACSRCQEILALLENTDHVVAVDELGKVDHPRASVLSTGGLYQDYAFPSVAVARLEGPAVVSQAPKEISSQRGFRTWRWMAPAGAIAAGLLIWVVARAPKYYPPVPSGNLQVAQEKTENDRLSSAYQRNATAAPAPAAIAEAPPTSRTTPQPAEKQQDGAGNLSSELEARNVPLNGRATSQLSRLAPGTAGESAQNELKEESRSREGNKAPARVSGSFMAKNAVVPSAMASPGTSEPQVRRDQMVASSKPSDSAGAGSAVAGAPAAAVDADSKVRESGGKLDRSATASQSVEVTGATAARQQTNVPAAAGRCEDKPKADESQKTSTVELNCPATAAVPTQQVESATALEGDTSYSLKKAKDVPPKIILTPDATVVWRLGGGRSVARSVDSGTTWVRQKTGASRELLAGSAPSDLVCWVVGRAGTILLSMDGGGHWSKIVSPIGADVVRVVAADALHAEIWGADGRSLATADGGKSWSAARQ